MLASIDTLDDAELADLIRDGSSEARQDAFEDLVRRHSPRLFQYLAGKGLVSEEREDVANETWFRVWRKLDRYEYREEVGFFPWVRAIANNVVREYERKHYLARGIGVLDAEIDDPGATDGALVHLTREEMRATIEALLPTVPNDDWRIVIEAHVADLWRTAEVMELYGWSQSKANTTKHRAFKWLKTRLLEIVGPTDMAAWLGDP